MADSRTSDRAGGVAGRHRLLILGGTAEAQAIAVAAAPRFAVTTSLAGRTVRPRLPAGAVRVGGFGGVAGLAAYLNAERIAAVIDATHPFAAVMSAHAVAACAETGVMRLVVRRPAWLPVPGDHWLSVPTLDAAARALTAMRLPAGVGALLTVGRGGLPAFAGCRGLRLVVRTVDDPAPLPFPAQVIRGRGPFDPVAEQALMMAEGIAVLVTRNSGGDDAKLIAARRCRLPVVMVERPPPSPGDTVGDAAAAMAWLGQRFDGRPPGIPDGRARPDSAIG